MSLVISPAPSSIRFDTLAPFSPSGAASSHAELPPPTPPSIAGPSRPHLTSFPALHTRHSSPTALHSSFASLSGPPAASSILPTLSNPIAAPPPPAPRPTINALPPAVTPPVPESDSDTGQDELSPAQREMPSLPPTLPPTPEPSPPTNKVLFPEKMVQLAPPADDFPSPAMAINLLPVEIQGTEEGIEGETKIPVIHIDSLPPDSPERPVEVRKRLSSRRKMPTSKQAQLLSSPNMVPFALPMSLDVEVDPEEMMDVLPARRASMEEQTIPAPLSAEASGSRVSLDISRLECHQGNSESVLMHPAKPRGPRRSYTAYNASAHSYAHTQPITSQPMSPSQSAGASGRPARGRAIPGGARHTSHNSSLASPPPPDFPRTYTAPAFTPPSLLRTTTPLPELNIHDTNGIEAKVALFGSLGAGKTSLVARYMRNTFSATPAPATIGGEFYTRKMKQDGIKISLQLWDTAGQERFRAMAPIYYRNAHVCILVYDITSRESFLDVKTWIDEITEKVPESMIFVVGAKADRSDRRAVSRMEVRVQIREWLRQTAPEPVFQSLPLTSGIDRRSSSSSRHSASRQPSQPQSQPTRSMSQSAFTFLNPAFSRSTPSLALGSPPSKSRSSNESTRESIMSTKPFPSTSYQSSRVSPPSKRTLELVASPRLSQSTQSVPSIKFPARAPTVTFMEPVPAHFTPASPTIDRPMRSSRFSISGISEVLGLSRAMSTSGAFSSLAKVAEEHQVSSGSLRERSIGGSTPHGSSVHLPGEALSITEFGPPVSSPSTGLRAFGPHPSSKPPISRSRTESTPFSHSRGLDLRRKSEDLSALVIKLKAEEEAARLVSMSRQSSDGPLERKADHGIPSPRPGTTRRRSGSLGTGPQLTFTSATPSHSHGSMPMTSRRGSIPLVIGPLVPLPRHDPSNDSFLPPQRGKSWLEAPDHLPWGRDVEGIRVGEVSALMGEGVKELFEAIAMRLVEKGDKIRKDTLLRRQKSFVLTAPEETKTREAGGGGGGWWFGWCAS